MQFRKDEPVTPMSKQDEPIYLTLREFKLELLKGRVPNFCPGIPKDWEKRQQKCKALEARDEQQVNL